MSSWLSHRRLLRHRIVAVSSSSCRHYVVVVVTSSLSLSLSVLSLSVLSLSSSLPSCCHCRHRHHRIIIIVIIIIAIASLLLLLSLSCYCCHRHQCIFLSSVYEQHCQGIPKPGGGLDWYLPTVFPSHPFDVIRRCQILLIASLGGTQECLVAYLKYSSGAVRYIHILE